MENKNFSDIGKIEAIRLLFEESHFKQADGTSYLCGEKGSVVRTASRIWLEGIDFDLTYFPLKHLGYKCVVGTVGELYASLARPQAISVRLGISNCGMASALQQKNTISVERIWTSFHHVTD